MPLDKAVPTLKQFMLRQQVLRLYRDCLRTIRSLPDQSQRKELLEWARADFKSNKGIEEEQTIRAMVQHGEKMLGELRQSLDLAGA